MVALSHFRDRRGEIMTGTGSAALVAAVFLCAAALSGCMQQTKTAWQHYDECAAETASFRAMVECGKQRRTAYCQEAGACSDLGTALVQYADALAQQVAHHEISEAQAREKFVAYKTAQIQAARQLQMQAAAAAASGPTVCNRTPTGAICF
jgi:hypothetical protein